MRTIIITTTPSLWAAAQKTGNYTQSTLDKNITEVGFIHATNPDQTAAMLNRRFKQRNDLLLLLVNVDKIRSEVKFEPTLSGTPGLFPHIYGPLNVDAVYKIVQPTKNKAGDYAEVDVQ